MNIRSAKITDVEAICSLINYYAERDKMLFRSMADIYENLQAFIVAELDGNVVGCCALQIVWSDLAEMCLSPDWYSCLRGPDGRGAGHHQEPVLC